MKVVEYGSQNREIIMLLHGGGLSWWNYRSEAELLGESYHVVLPVLDGHAGSTDDFVSIEENAGRIVSFIDREYGGSVLLIGGLSLGAQILVEMLSRRADICRYAVIESASVIPSKMTNALIGPAFSSSYGLIRNRQFSKLQFRYLRMRSDLFDDYYKDTTEITKSNMIAFLKANTAYSMKPGVRNCRAQVRIAVGEKEQKSMLRSAQMLHEAMPGSVLEVMDGLYHGEYSIDHPQQYVQDMLAFIEK